MPRSHAHVVALSVCPRVTADADREYFLGLLNDKLTHTFGTPLKHLFKEGVVHPYGDFLREVPEGKIAPYEELADAPKLKTYMEEKLEDYNSEAGAQVMDLVMFSDAINHICRIKRILSMPRGHALLVGVGGSGRQSLTRLAAYIANFKVPTIGLQ